MERVLKQLIEIGQFTVILISQLIAVVRNIRRLHENGAAGCLVGLQVTALTRRSAWVCVCVSLNYSNVGWLWAVLVQAPLHNSIPCQSDYDSWAQD